MGTKSVSSENLCKGMKHDSSVKKANAKVVGSADNRSETHLTKLKRKEKCKRGAHHDYKQHKE